MAQSMEDTKIQALLHMGQTVWLDYLHRDMTRSGELRALIEHGLRGITSNPTIFARAVARSGSYDTDLAELAMFVMTDREPFEVLAIEDVQEAAELFRPIYDSTHGRDGFVSLEVWPGVARDVEGTVAEARRLWNALDRPNVMIQIPGMREALPAVEQCLLEGININITPLFSVDHYQAIADAYVRALEARVERGQPIDGVASVASFFLSPIDTEVDALIRIHHAVRHLHGKVAIAAARLAYESFGEITRSARWKALEARGAQTQRLLWAGTGTKNSAYSDVLYVESLIGPDTITAVPPETLRLFEDHGTVAPTLNGIAVRDAVCVMDTLTQAGVDLSYLNDTLEEQALAELAHSFDRLLRVLADKRRSLTLATSLNHMGHEEPYTAEGDL